MRWLLIVVAQLALHLVQLTGPDGQILVINPAQIITAREPRDPAHFGPGTHCILHTTDGKFVAVAEDCRTVRERIETLDED